MNDITLIYYTANRISEHFAESVRQSLLKCQFWSLSEIVSVSHRPFPFEGFGGLNLVVGDVEPSIYQVYRNILTGAKSAYSPYVACCEDDTLYASSHFTYRPALDTFAYDLSRWVITRDLAANGKSRVAKYYWRKRHQMAMCIAPTALLIETLEERFAKYPEPVPHDVAKKTGWGEPGRYEKNLGLAPRKMEYFSASEPSVTFNHSESLMGRRRVNPDDRIVHDLPPWGDATALWNRVHG